MTTRLESALRRELDVAGVTYTLTIDGDGLRLVEKGRRKGFELAWRDFVSGDAALARALQASVAAAPPPRAVVPRKPAKTPAKKASRTR